MLYKDDVKKYWLIFINFRNLYYYRINPGK
jgi:hypothetical protein